MEIDHLGKPGRNYAHQIINILNQSCGISNNGCNPSGCTERSSEFLDDVDGPQRYFTKTANLLTQMICQSAQLFFASRKAYAVMLYTVTASE